MEHEEEDLSKRNWPAINDELQHVVPLYLRPTWLAECVLECNRGGNELFYCDDAFYVICEGHTGSLAGDVEFALDCWLQEVKRVLEVELGFADSDLVDLHIHDIEPLVLRLMSAAQRPLPCDK